MCLIKGGSRHNFKTTAANDFTALCVGNYKNIQTIIIINLYLFMLAELLV